MKLDQNTRYEIKAECFRIMSGHMAPGKDCAPESYPAPFKERAKLWDSWYEKNHKLINAMLTAVESMLPDNDE